MNDQKWTEGNFKAHVKVEKADAPRRAGYLLAGGRSSPALAK